MPSPVTDASISQHFVLIRELQVKAEGPTVSSKAQFTQTSPIAIYVPYIVGFLLFVSVLYMMSKGTRSMKGIILAILIALFAATIPTALVYVQFGTRFGAKAAPEEQPRNVRIGRASDTSATIFWQTDTKTLGAIRMDEAPFHPSESKVIIASGGKAGTIHEAVIDRITRGKTYEVEVFSGTRWYNAAGVPIRFTFR